MLRIRLKRCGTKKKPYYHIVVADKKASRDGRFVEQIGTYAPLLKENTTSLQDDRAKYWLGVGAQPSERVARLLKGKGYDMTIPLRKPVKAEKKTEAAG
ncbi:MAG: 30S ribosomal protein S16 [Deltaproteobacteria bacterium]|nr:30S ribosomal protein S16 [Deltaproteobacteria bacterium]